MRTEKEMMELILGVAERDERIRGVYMNGSRTNANVPKDLFQDYDIVYIVTEIGSFLDNSSWIDCFGDRLMMQMPEEMDRLRGIETVSDERYAYLIQLADGNRLDLSLSTLNNSIRSMEEDHLCVLLMDKDGVVGPIVPANDRQRWIKKPDQLEFDCCLNEFWWLLNNIGKGLWREELLYVLEMIDRYLRPELLRLLSWEAGENTNYTASIGKSAKYLSNYLAKEEYEQYLRSFPQAQTAEIWEATGQMCDQFSRVSRRLADRFGFRLDQAQEKNSRLFLACTKCLPRNAEQFIFVREGTKEDFRELADLWLAANLDAHSFISPDYWNGSYQKVLDALADAKIYVYEDHTGIRGFAGIRELDERGRESVKPDELIELHMAESIAGRAYLEGLFVKATDRAKGVGSSLLAVCKAYYSELELQVYEKNKTACRFYESQGFHKTEVSQDKAMGEDVWNMVWDNS